MPNVKFIPKNIEQAREVLIDFPADLEIELEYRRRSREAAMTSVLIVAARLRPYCISKGLS